ncbi:MAG: OadG family protein [Lachnospiraceae bacterium]|nr:OadG family protein [Lachnospiraceae bacterium]
MKKRLALICCIISCMLVMAGCSFSLVKTNEKFDDKVLEENTDSFVQSWFEYDFESAVTDYAGQLDDETLSQYKDSKKLRDKYGKYDKKDDSSLTITTDTATVTETVLTDSGKKLVFSVTYDENGNTVSWNVDEYKTKGEIMGKAGLNTVMSMAIVFLVLIFIAVIIAQFKYIGNAQNRKKEAEPVVEAVPAAPAVVEEEDLTDDLELVAVITAAIAAASENECTDGLIIRSIIRK